MSFRAHGSTILVFITQKGHADRKFLTRTMQIINSLLIVQKNASYLHAAATVSKLYPAVSNSFRSSSMNLLYVAVLQAKCSGDASRHPYITIVESCSEYRLPSCIPTALECSRGPAVTRVDAGVVWHAGFNFFIMKLHSLPSCSNDVYHPGLLITVPGISRHATEDRHTPPCTVRPECWMTRSRLTYIVCTFQFSS